MSEDFATRLKKIQDAQQAKEEVHRSLNTEFIKEWNRVADVIRPVFWAAAEQMSEVGISIRPEPNDVVLQWIGKKTSPRYELRYRPLFSERKVSLIESTPSGSNTTPLSIGSISTATVEKQVADFVQSVIF